MSALSNDFLIQEFRQLDRASPRFSDELTALLGKKEILDHVLGLSVVDANLFVEDLESVRTPFHSS